MPDAREIAQKYMTPRYKRMERHEKYVDGVQYDGRAPFLATDDAAPPLLERAPCVVDHIARNAIGDLTDFMLGEGRYPFISAGSSEDDEELDDDWGLDEDDSALFERWLNGPLTKAARLRRILPEALKLAMKAGSVALVASMRRGQPRLEALPAKWCTPTFDTTTGEVVQLEIKYPYIVEERDKYDPTKWVEVCYLYRRVIDIAADTVYLPGKGRGDGREPAWTVDNSQTRPHGLGYCPVCWYAFDRDTPTAACFDGTPLHDTLHDELDALNFSRSQRHRAALYAGDPQIVETGVDEDVKPAPKGQAPRIEVEAQAGRPGEKPIGVFTSAPKRYGRGGLRKKGPGVVWRYPDAQSKVQLLTLGSDALGAITENSEDIRKKLAEDLSVVLMDPTNVKAFGAMSGKALAFMFARQIARADSIRQDAGDNLILACVDLLLRLCLTAERLQPKGVRVPGMSKVLPLLEGFERDVSQAAIVTDDGMEVAPATTRKEWFSPRLDLEWGPYFQSSAEEENFLVTMCVTAYTNGLMPLEVVLEKLRSVFSFGSTEELLKRLEEAKVKKQKEQLAQQEAQASLAAKYAPDGGGKGPPGKGPPQAKAGSASGAKGDSKA